MFECLCRVCHRAGRAPTSSSVKCCQVLAALAVLRCHAPRWLCWLCWLSSLRWKFPLPRPLLRLPRPRPLFSDALRVSECLGLPVPGAQVSTALSVTGKVPLVVKVWSKRPPRSAKALDASAVAPFKSPDPAK